MKTCSEFGIGKRHYGKNGKLLVHIAEEFNIPIIANNEMFIFFKLTDIDEKLANKFKLVLEDLCNPLPAKPDKSDEWKSL